MSLRRLPADIYSVLLRNGRRALVGLAFALLPATSAVAMSYMPMTDEALLTSANLVVIGKIVEVRGAAGRELDETSYRLQPDEVLKGSVSAGDLEVRLPGGFDQTAAGALIVPGMPRFAVDEPVLLFLNQRADLSYSPSQLLLGVFRVRKDVAGESILTQDLEQAEAISDPDKPRGHRRVRQTERFASWIRDRARGRPHDESYWSDTDVAPDGKYRLASPPVRWFQFQDNLDVTIYSNDDGSSGTDPSDLQSAINAWNSAPGSTVSLVYGGMSSRASGLEVADGVNEVLFNDPNDDLPGTFDCLLGGLGAYGKWRRLGTRDYNGESYGVISEGDIVFQDGISCLFSGFRNENAQELIAHELGHVLGLDHPCGDGLLAICTSGTVEDQALMRPTLHGEGRGASLNSDDIAGLAKLYAPASGNSVIVNPGTGSGTESSSGGGSIDLLSLGLLMLTFLGALARSIFTDRSSLRAATAVDVR